MLVLRYTMAAPAIAGGVAVLGSACALIKRRAGRCERQCKFVACSSLCRVRMTPAHPYVAARHPCKRRLTILDQLLLHRRRYTHDDGSAHADGQQAAETRTRSDGVDAHQTAATVANIAVSISATSDHSLAPQTSVCTPSVQSPAVMTAGALVTLYTPIGELIIVQQAGEPGQQRWALSTIRAHTQEDAPLGGQSFQVIRYDSDLYRNTVELRAATVTGP